MWLQQLIRRDAVNNTDSYSAPNDCVLCKARARALRAHAGNYKVFADFPSPTRVAARADWITGDRAFS